LSGNGYLRTACDYVHLNPVRAGLLPPSERLLAYPWSRFGAYLAAAAAHRPGWIVAAELQRLGWTETELAARRKRDPLKLALATRLRQETTLSLKAMAKRVQLGTAKGANTNLHNWMRAQTLQRPAQTHPDL